MQKTETNHIIQGERKMKKGDLPKASVVFLLCLLIAAAGCFWTAGCIPTEKYERIVHLSAPLSPGGSFEAQTHNGYINITGADVADCNLTAAIIARADTEENAKKLAEQVKVKLVPSGNKLIAKIEKPALVPGKYVSVSLDVTVPNHTDTELTTHNGAIRIANITGRLNGTTHNGKVAAEKISGTAKFETHNGKIICEEVSGDIQLETHNGGIKADYSKNAPPVCNVSMVTHNGGITLTTPPSFSAKVDASTHNGSIDTDLPITVIGKVTKRRLTGTIGTGQGKLHLETHNGSIKIR
jgi:hypothetical protein